MNARKGYGKKHFPVPLYSLSSLSSLSSLLSLSLLSSLLSPSSLPSLSSLSSLLSLFVKRGTEKCIYKHPMYVSDTKKHPHRPLRVRRRGAVGTAPSPQTRGNSRPQTMRKREAFSPPFLLSSARRQASRPLDGGEGCGCPCRYGLVACRFAVFCRRFISRQYGYPCRYGLEACRCGFQ